MTPSLLIKPDDYPPVFDLRSDCHLWFLDTEQLSESLIAKYKFVLSQNDLTRAHAMKRRQLEFIAIREFVRLCLARYTNLSPQDLALQANAKGKPFLVNSPIKFNLSHSNTMAVIAIDACCDVGVDIESILRHRDHRNIAERYFHPQEIATLSTLNNDDHDNYFFRLWTLKEAFLKATGEGISAGLEKVAFQFDGDAIISTMTKELKTDASDWQFYQAFLSEEFCVALARHSAQLLHVRWFDGTQLFA